MNKKTRGNPRWIKGGLGEETHAITTRLTTTDLANLDGVRKENSRSAMIRQAIRELIRKHLKRGAK